MRIVKLYQFSQIKRQKDIGCKEGFLTRASKLIFLNINEKEPVQILAIFVVLFETISISL